MLQIRREYVIIHLQAAKKSLLLGNSNKKSFFRLNSTLARSLEKHTFKVRRQSLVCVTLVSSLVRIIEQKTVSRITRTRERKRGKIEGKLRIVKAIPVYKLQYVGTRREQNRLN